MKQFYAIKLINARFKANNVVSMMWVRKKKYRLQRPAKLAALTILPRARTVVQQLIAAADWRQQTNNDQFDQHVIFTSIPGHLFSKSVMQKDAKGRTSGKLSQEPILIGATIINTLTGEYIMPRDEFLVESIRLNKREEAWMGTFIGVSPHALDQAKARLVLLTMDHTETMIVAPEYATATDSVTPDVDWAYCDNALKQVPTYTHELNATVRKSRRL
jgi:hypothetical protein